MAARSFDGCALTAAQSEALSAVGVTSVGDISCSAGDLNTCGRDARELISLYPFYDPGKGIYTQWGDIPWSWDHEDALSDERWQVATYTDTLSYRIGDSILRIEDEGRRLTVYTATSDVPVPAGAFDPDLWSEVCHIVVSEPIGLPDIGALEEQYSYYAPEEYLTEWGDFTESWSTDLVNPDSDQWDGAKIAKQYFYRSGDIVLYDTACGDHTCIYVATADMPADAALVVPGPPPSAFWQRQYCVENGKPSKCDKRIECGPGRVVVDLGGEDAPNLVCVPVESSVGVGPRGYESLR